MRAAFSLLAFFTILFSAQGGEIPFDYVDGYVLLHASVNAHPVTLILDSGASASILSLDAARRLQLPLGKSEPVDGVDADATAYNITPVIAKFGAFSLGEISLAIDLQNAAQLCTAHVDGLIGAGFFKGRVTQIDYARHRLILLDDAPVALTGETLPLRTRNGIFLLPVSVNGSHPRWTRIDTGCNDALHWVVPRSASTQARGLSVGFITNTADETLVTVSLGKLTMPHTETALHGSSIFPGEAGLLGGQILSKYRVTIDARAGRITFSPASR